MSDKFWDFWAKKLRQGFQNRNQPVQGKNLRKTFRKKDAFLIISVLWATNFCTLGKKHRHGVLKLNSASPNEGFEDLFKKNVDFLVFFRNLSGNVSDFCKNITAGFATLQSTFYVTRETIYKNFFFKSWI